MNPRLFILSSIDSWEKHAKSPSSDPVDYCYYHTMLKLKKYMNEWNENIYDYFGYDTFKYCFVRTMNIVHDYEDWKKKNIGIQHSGHDIDFVLTAIAQLQGHIEIIALLKVRDIHE